jgi:Zn-dependent peptidase ImmA (M78 family)/DNA-binding XRE family transcriptional regulator
MSTAMITPTVVQWARQRAQIEPEQLAARLNVKREKLLHWEQGEAMPTFRQAQNLAQALHIPFGYLFLPEPPQEILPIPDLRTVGSKRPAGISPDLSDLLAEVLYKHSWYREYRLEQGAEPLPFVGRFRIQNDVKQVAADIGATLSLTIDDRKGANNGEAFLKLLVARAEAAGIWVMISGVVGNNSHRALDVQEFRGFVISDEIAPLVFVNGKDAKPAQTFTLAHELAHLWIGQSGITNLALNTVVGAGYHGTECFCNAVAAEVLVPADLLMARCRDESVLLDGTLAGIEKLATFFRVSTVVVARRAADLDLISQETFRKYYQQQAALWQQRAVKKSSGGSLYRTVPVRNGRRYTEDVVRTALEQRLLLRDAGRLLNVQPSKIGRLAQEIGIA